MELSVRSRAPAPQEVLAELARVLAADKIARNPNTSRFLRYVVEETLAGRGERLKAFSIATQALGRSENFDPQTDSIVRVQAVRVRAQLEEYYAGPGVADAVRIVLPKGAYQPRFEALPEVEAEVSEPPPLPLPPVRKAHAMRLPLRGLSALGLVVLGALALAVAWRAWRAGPPDATPVLALSVRGPAAGMTDRLLTLVETDAAASEYVRVRRRATGADLGADYDLEARFSDVKAESFDVAFLITERRSGEVIWTKTFDDVGDDRARMDTLARTVGAASGEVGGALLVDLYRRLQSAGTPLEGQFCRLSALHYLLLREEGRRQEAHDCLEAQVAHEPDDPRSLTLLSTLLVQGYIENLPGAKGEADAQRGLQLARRAYDLNPASVNALAAMFYARFAERRYEDAFAFAALMREKRPDAVLVRLRLGRAYVSRARYAEGVAELEALEAQLGAPQPVATAFLALAALMRDDMPALTRYERRTVADATPLGLILGMIASRERGDWDKVRIRRQRLEAQYPQIAADLGAAFDRYGLEPSIAKRLTTEVAGLGMANQE